MGEHQDMEDLDERLTLVLELDDYADSVRGAMKVINLTKPKPSEEKAGFPPFGWRIVNTCLELTFLNRDDAVSALGQLQGLRAQATPGEAERP